MQGTQVQYLVQEVPHAMAQLNPCATYSAQLPRPPAWQQESNPCLLQLEKAHTHQ